MHLRNGTIHRHAPRQTVYNTNRSLNRICGFIGMRKFNRRALRDLFLKQQFHTLNMLIGMEAFHHHIIQKIIGCRHQDHALMMRHIRLHNCGGLSGRQARLGVIQRFVKAKAPKHIQLLQLRHILQHCLRLKGKPH